MIKDYKMKNYYSDELKDKIMNIESLNIEEISFFDAESILSLLFKETDLKIKEVVLPEHRRFFPTTKIHKNWEGSSLFGSNHLLSGGVTLQRSLLWNSSYNFHNKEGSISNKRSTSFIIDLNGDIYNLVDLTKVNRDKNPITNTVGITYVNTGLLKKKDNDFYWHSGSVNRWGLKYPYVDSLVPVKIDSDADNLYYQPISREQLFSSMILNRVLSSFFIDGYKPFVGDSFFEKMVDIRAYLDYVYKNDKTILDNSYCFDKE